MASLFTKAAANHKAQFARFVAEGPLVEVRQPADPLASTTAVDKVFGRASEASGPDSFGEIQTVQGIWSGSPSLDPYSRVPATIAMLGRTDKLDALFRCVVADVLLDPEKPRGRTLFHTARLVVFQGESYTVSGVEFSGLPPLDPYICWVGLKKAGTI